MLETYYKYRMEYKDFLLFIKIGNFYEVFDKDSLILNKLFGYKIKRIKDSIKVGFPLSRLDYILKLIGNINYVVIDNTVVEKKEFNKNKYKDYNFDINSIILNSIKIDRIYEELSSRLLDNNIENIKELLNNGVNVILDRYVESNMAYQSAKLETSADKNHMMKWLEKLEYELLELPRPDLVIFLYMPYQYSMELRKNDINYNFIAEKY